MKKSTLTIFLLSASLLLANEKGMDPSIQAKADQQMKLQNESVIKHVIEEYSAKVPQKVDDFTTFTNISSEDLTLIYTFEINTGAKSDESVINEDGPRMKKYIKEGICMSSKRFLQSDINIKYLYKSKMSQKELFNFYVEAKDCKPFWN